MLDLQKKRVQLAAFVCGLIILSMTAEKFRELVGDEGSSKSGKFTIFNCLDMGSGTVACGVKESVKLYIYSIRSAHVEKVRQRATEMALVEGLKEGLSASEAAKQAQKTGAKAAKLATRQAKRIVGPISSSGWDFFEAIYYGGTTTEGFLRGAGTLCGTYAGGFHGEQRLGRLGYLGGSHLGSWIGGRIGLMIYDVVNGVHHLLHFAETEVIGNAGSGEATESYERRAEDSESYAYRSENRVEDSESYENTPENTESSSWW